MKITFTPAQLFVEKRNMNKRTPQNSPINQTGTTIELSNFNSVGRSLVTFRGEDNTQNDMNFVNKSIEELKELKEMLSGSAAENKQKIQAAQEKLDAIEAWNYDKEYLKQQNDADAEINKENLSRFFNPFQCHEIKQKHYNNFSRRNKQIKEYQSKEEHYKDIVNMQTSNAQQTNNLIQSIDNIIAQKEKIEAQNIIIEKQQKWQDVVTNIQNSYKLMRNSSGGLDERIAGYDYLKDELRTRFIAPLANSENKMKVPSAIMLHGARGTGKTEIINAIAEEAEAGGYAVVKNIDTSMMTLEEFKTEIREQIGKAITRYKNEGKRTVILVDEIEKYLSFTTTQEAKDEYPGLIDEKDIKSIKDYATNAGFINEMKVLLGNCSETPSKSKKEEDKSGAYATTFFFTTNHPHLIDREILRKMSFYCAVNPAKNEDLIDIVKHYTKKSSDFVNSIKKSALNENFKPETISELELGLSHDATENLKKMAKENRINELNIDVEKIDFSTIPEFFNPTKEDGAFHNGQLMSAAIQALNSYIADPSSEYDTYLWNSLFSMKRDITPASNRKYIAIYNELAPECDRESDDSPISKKEEENLRKMAKAGKLTGKFKSRWEYIQKRYFAELNKLETLEQEGKLSSEQEQRLEELRNFKNNADVK